MNVSELDMNQAACASVDPDMFFPEQGGKYRTAEAAKQVCATCPVVTDCLNVALSNGYDGVWGGMTLLERESYKRRMRRQRPRRMHENSLANLVVDKSKKSAHLVAANAARLVQVNSRAVAKTMEAVEKLGDKIPAQLALVAKLRIENPDASMVELSQMMGVTKDSYAGYLRRLITLAQK